MKLTLIILLIATAIAAYLLSRRPKVSDEELIRDFNVFKNRSDLRSDMSSYASQLKGEFSKNEIRRLIELKQLNEVEIYHLKPFI